MAVTIINRTTLDKSYAVLVNQKKVDVLIPYETLLVPLQKEPSQIRFRFTTVKPVEVVHDDILVLTDHKIGVWVRNPWIVSAIIALAQLIPYWLSPYHLEDFSSFEAYNHYFFWYRALTFTSIAIIPSILALIFPAFNVSKE